MREYMYMQLYLSVLAPSVGRVLGRCTDELPASLLIRGCCFQDEDESCGSTSSMIQYVYAYILVLFNKVQPNNHTNDVHLQLIMFPRYRYLSSRIGELRKSHR